MASPATQAAPLVAVGILSAFAVATATEPTAAPRVPALPTLHPVPTEHWLAPNAESDNKARRKAHYARIHSSPPDVDWRSIERENGKQRTQRRNARATLPPAADGTEHWVERGSENQAGRVHVARRSADNTLLYAGSAYGGVWRGSPEGTDWTPLGDNLYGGAHWLEVIEDTIIAGTDGGLLHWTDDFGVTWNAAGGIGDPSQMRRLTVQTGGDEALLAVVLGRNYQVFASTDRGQTFYGIANLGTFRGDIWTSRTGDDRLYLATADGLSISDDTGRSWTLQGPWPGTPSQAELAGSEAGGPRLWVVLDSSALYRSDDEGQTWTFVTEVTDYWGTLNASIHDPNVVAWGGVQVYYTTDGATFDIVNRWEEYYTSPHRRLHADIPGLDVVDDGDGTETWYISTDGGLYASTDTLSSVDNLSLNGLRISQYYDVLTSTANPAHIAAGAQDQGYQATNPLPATTDDRKEFSQLISGDYGHLTSVDGTHSVVFATYPGFILIHMGEDSPEMGGLDFPSGETMAWIPPVVAANDGTWDFYLLGAHLYRYVYDGTTWNPEQWSTRDFSGRGYDYLSALTFSPLDPTRAYAVTSDGVAYTSTDTGRTWTPSTSGIPDGQYFYGHAILASSTDVDHVWIGGSGYGNPAIVESTDGGRTFHAFDEGVEPTLVYCLAEAPDGSGRLVAGTQQTVLRRDPSDAAWVEVTGTDAPVTIYWGCEALTHENTIRFATYGRGIWDYQLDPENLGCFPAQDADGDGVDCTLDCDDTDANITPGRAEDCDGIDQNCDPTDLSEGDADGDGFWACEDCDDTDPTVFPGALDTCDDGIDQDCDGQDPSCDVAEKQGGCACSSTAFPSQLFLWPALVGVLGLRRRQKSTES